MRRLVLIAAFISICSGLRCFVDHRATESVDCGPHSGCIKVAEKNITNLGTKSWYGTQPKFENQSKSFIFKFSLQVWQSHHSSYWNRIEARLLRSPGSRSMFWSRQQFDLLLVHVERFLQPFFQQTSVWFKNPLGFRLHCDDNEMKDIKSQLLKFTFKVSFVKKIGEKLWDFLSNF